jgi:hypothetical protein
MQEKAIEDMNLWRHLACTTWKKYYVINMGNFLLHETKTCYYVMLEYSVMKRVFHVWLLKPSGNIMSDLLYQPTLLHFVHRVY